ncbi:hypothetical protein [Arcticibacterium luteifluviistationis]|uniref:Uncharacterized protein n=1 Tax=Arcticibacterium luteifluviistationis TaxID=1784714 RepID=A0A2Z4GC04_9BACT|nr:hypothetical protein [Arcticibacterium luteifluviistationis]AWV98829.1 hypothetical protein DJ013_11860 [Arcticibacterium luteifluviistationis]
MKIYHLSFFLLIPFVESCIYPQTQSTGNIEQSAEEVIIDEDVSYDNLKVGKGLLETKQEAFVKGEQYFDKGLKTASLLNLKVDGRENLLLTDTQWDDVWEDDMNNTKVVFWETEHFKEVRDNKLKDANVEAMRGFDFAPMVLQMKNVTPWNGGPFVQHFVHIPGESRNHWKDGSLEYFFMPDDFPDDIANTHLPQFYKYFPDYSLPKNKIGMTSFMINDDENNAAGRKGYTYTNSFVAPASQRVYYDYDTWLYESGAPPAYSVSQEEVNAWLDKVDENLLYRNFEKHVLNKYQNVGHLVLNWEALRSPYGKSIYKLERCLNAFKAKYPNTTLSLWPHGLFFLNRVNIEGNNFKYELTDDIKFTGNLGEWDTQKNPESPFSINSFYLNNVDINYVGGYLNYPTNYGYVQHMLMQHMMNKKFQPNKKSILMWWHNQEYVGAFEKGKEWFTDSKGRTLSVDTKPMVFPSAMHNAAVWAFAFCDGGELWSEPYSRRDQNDYLGASTEVYDTRGNKIATSFSPKFTGQYAIQNYRNIDRWEGGKWAVSANKDIIEAKTDWDFVPSARENGRFTAGDGVLPSYSLYDKSQLVAVKYSESGTEALLLVYDAWNEPLNQEKIKVKLNGKVVSVDVFGRYTSVVRVTDL